MPDIPRLSFGREHRPRQPRHYFDFPAEVRAAVESHVAQAIAAIDPARFAQEADYVAAIAGRLTGPAYSGVHGSVIFQSTIITSRGRRSAESWSGADWIITARISDGSETISKAITIQAKLGPIPGLTANQRETLQEQVKKIHRITRAPKIMEIAQAAGQREPRIISGDGWLRNRHIQSVPLARYMSSRVLTTLHGDTRPAFVRAAENSALTRLHVAAELEETA